MIPIFALHWFFLKFNYSFHICTVSDTWPLLQTRQPIWSWTFVGQNGPPIFYKSDHLKLGLMFFFNPRHYVASFTNQKNNLNKLNFRPILHLSCNYNKESTHFNIHTEQGMEFHWKACEWVLGNMAVFSASVELHSAHCTSHLAFHLFVVHSSILWP